MLLAQQDAELFFRIHKALMCFVNDRLQIVPNINSPDEFAGLSPQKRSEIRKVFLKNVDLLESFVAANPFDLSDEELEIVSSWRHQVAGKFFIIRYLKKFAIFLASGEPPIAYGVLALTQSFEELVGPYLPVWSETVLLPFRGKIIYDGLLNNYNISFGPGIRRNLNEDYNAAKQRLGIVTSLPVAAQPAIKRKPTKKAQRKPAPASSKDAGEVQRVIVGMTDQFCRDNLSEEYAVQCRKLADKLARKRPSPLVSGRPNTWASGIVRAIGWVNFLDDPSQQPHLKLTDIDKAFGVGASTGQAKSMLIRKLFKMRRFDVEWTLPSRIDDNPLVWMLEVNGFMMDIRDCPREAQEIAFEKGLIPYIPADRE
jgi:Domain of unknown function (DUF6398)